MFAHRSAPPAAIALVSALVLMAAILPAPAAAIACGELLHEGETCTMWQCSRNVSNFCVRGEPVGGLCESDSDCYYEMHCSFENQTIVTPNGTNTTAMIGTCAKNGSGNKNLGIGLVGAFLGVLCFGSSFVPIKRYKKYAGDGVFAQFCMCFGRFMVGVCFLAASKNLTFYWTAAAGGALWTIGNVLSVPIIQCVGIGLGVSIWGTTNMLLGWASGHFGLMGVKKEVTEYPVFEYLSVAASFVSIILFIFVKPSSRVQKNDVPEDYASPVGSPTFGDEKQKRQSGSKFPLLEEDEASTTNEDANINHNTSNADTSVDAVSLKSATAGGTSAYREDEDDIVGEKSALIVQTGAAVPKKQTLSDTLGERNARILGICMALTSGCLYGICMDPAQHLMSHYDELSAESDYYKFSPLGLDYVFSNNVGAMCMSFVVLVTYLILQKFGLTPSEKYFEPVEHSKLLLPAFAAGAIGSMGSAAWFFANQNLGLVVSFPIIAAGPGVVSSLWGAIVFKEVHGLRNFIILGGAFLTVIAAAVFSSVAKG